MVAGRWRDALGDAPSTHGGGQRGRPAGDLGGRAAARRVVWVAAGLGWRSDAVGCPACEGRITFAADGDVVVPRAVSPGPRST